MAEDLAVTLGRAALAYAAIGWPVFPLHPGTKEPRTYGGFTDASTDPEDIRIYWRPGGPAYNIGIATGAPGPDVLDFEATPGGARAYRRLTAAGLLAGAFAMVSTRSGGLHLYYPGTRQHNAARLAGPKTADFRGSGGYVVAAPSVVERDDGTTGTYALTDTRPLAEGRPFRLDKARRLLSPPRPRPGQGVLPARQPRSVKRLAEWVAAGPDGFDGHLRLYWAACRAAGAGQGTGPLLTAAVKAGLDPDEAGRTIANAQKRVSDDRVPV